MRLPYSPLFLVAAALCGPLGEAEANSDPQLRAELGGGYACFADERRFHGALGEAVLSYTHDGFWSAEANYALGVHRSKGQSFQVQQLGLGLRYNLDVFAYVPWITVAPVALVATGSDAPDLGGALAIGFGFDRLLDEHWSLGFAGRYDQVFGLSAFPAYMHLGLRLGYGGALWDPLAP